MEDKWKKESETYMKHVDSIKSFTTFPTFDDDEEIVNITYWFSILYLQLFFEVCEGSPTTRNEILFKNCIF